jgi:hypothetical protein
MLNGVLTGSEEGDAKLDHQGVVSWTPVASLCSAMTYRMIRGTQSGVTQRYYHPVGSSGASSVKDSSIGAKTSCADAPGALSSIPLQSCSKR